MLANCRPVKAGPSPDITALTLPSPAVSSWPKLRPYPTRAVVSPSLARTQRILELHHRIAAKVDSRPNAQQQREQNFAIAKRAKFIREIRDLEAHIVRAECYSTAMELKRKLRVVNEKLQMFDEWQLQAERSAGWQRAAA